MTARDSASDYPLGATDAEHERLIRQAQWVNPHTERCFREAGIGPGYRVLDLGSGAGDVALLLAKLVGPTGEVVGVERDPRTIARARNRIAAAGLHNVSFTECDASQVSDRANFDAAVGRHVLLFLPDPVAVLRSLSELVRPGGVLAFQEMDWGLFMTHAHSFPLWSAAASLIDETCRQSGTNFYLAPKLSELFGEAGKPTAPNFLQQQARFDKFIEVFNHQRPHEALHMKCPAEVYRPSPRPYTGLPDIDYPLHDKTIVVTRCGRICLGNKKINFSQVFAGQAVGIKEVHDDILAGQLYGL